MRYLSTAVTHIAGMGAFVFLHLEGHTIVGWALYAFSFIMALLIMTHDPLRAIK